MGNSQNIPSVSLPQLEKLLGEAVPTPGQTDDRGGPVYTDEALLARHALAWAAVNSLPALLTAVKALRAAANYARPVDLQAAAIQGGVDIEAALALFQFEDSE